MDPARATHLDKARLDGYIPVVPYSPDPGRADVSFLRTNKAYGSRAAVIGVPVWLPTANIAVLMSVALSAETHGVARKQGVAEATGIGPARLRS